MNKKLLLVSTLSLNLAVVAQPAPPPNPVVQQYQQQVTDAQKLALTNIKQYYPPANVVDLGNVQNALNYIGAGVNALVIYISNTLTNLVFQPTYNVAQSMATGVAQNTTIGITDTSSTLAKLTPYSSDSQPFAPTLTGQDIFNTMTNTKTANTYTVFGSNKTIPILMYSSPTCTYGFSVPGNPCIKSGTDANTIQLNMNSLLGPFQLPTSGGGLTQQLPQYSFAYQPGQTQTAQNYIQFVSGNATPLTLIDLSVCKNH